MANKSLPSSFTKAVGRLLIPLLTLFAANTLHSDQVGILQTKDIAKVMQQILDQHADQKEMSAKILKNAFKVYIDQFDPDRLYLLESEVSPYLDLKDADTLRYMEMYKQGQFQEFVDLNNTIQKSITRARKIRSDLYKNDSQEMFNDSKKIHVDGVEDWNDPNLKNNFAKTDKELSNRIKNNAEKFLAFERKRYGDDSIKDKEQQVLALYEKRTREVEDPYMYENKNGQPMTPAEKDSAFAVHVLKALTNSLDAHTTILNPSEAYDMRLRLEKGVQGIGVMLQIDKQGQVLISKILENSPAQKNGQIKIDDQLLEIDGTNTNNKSMDELMSLVNGKAGSKATLVLKHKDSNTPYRVELQRAEIAVNEDRADVISVPFGNGIIGIIKLDSFYQNDDGVTSEGDVAAGIKTLQKNGNLRGLILDFRENSGGFLSQAIKVAGLFITNGIVVISKYFNGEEHFYRDMDGKVSYDGPLIILTSKATASAAEIVAQALQDYGVAVIVGDEHTYGKGTIQSQTVTDGNSSAYFKVTVGKYYTVSGKTPQLDGVKADVVVPSQFIHENIGEEYLENPLPKDSIAAAYNDNLQDITPSLKPWYMNYYMPTLQHKIDIPSDIIPALKKNSQQRILNNPAYEAFIKDDVVKRGQRPDDLQLTETINVMKDLIALEEKQRRNLALQ